MRPQEILFGILLLVAGRQLFWVFVAILGFLYGFQLAPLLFSAPSESTVWLLALGGGLAGAGLAIFLQKPAAALAGFLAGGYTAAVWTFGAQWGNVEGWLVPYLVGGVIGFILVLVIFEWAIMLLSALTGASLLVQNFAPSGDASVWIAVIAAVGVAVQAAMMGVFRPKTSPPPESR